MTFKRYNNYANLKKNSNNQLYEKYFEILK